MSSLDEIKEMLRGFVLDFHTSNRGNLDELLDLVENNEKNDDASILLREEGNRLYQAKKLQVQILDCSAATESLSPALPGNKVIILLSLLLLATGCN